MKSQVWALAHGSCLLNVQLFFSPGLFYCVCLTWIRKGGKNSPQSPACPFQFYCEVDSEGMQKPMMEALLSLWLWPLGCTAQQWKQIQTAHGEFVCLQDIVPVLIQWTLKHFVKKKWNHFYNCVAVVDFECYWLHTWIFIFKNTFLSTALSFLRIYFI